MKRSIAKKLDEKFEKIKFAATNKVIIFLGVFVLIIAAVQYAESQHYFIIPEFILEAIRGIFIIVTAFFVASLIIRFTTNKVAKLYDDAEIEQRLLLTKMYSVVVYTIATLYVFWRFGVGLQNITLFVGLIATGIALAVRDILASYLVWMMLLVKKPFRIGDYIRVGEDEGVVKHIGTFYVLIDDSPESYSDFVRIPNKVFLEKSIQNYGRHEIPFDVTHPIAKLPKNVDGVLGRVEKDIKKKIGKDVSVVLDRDKDKLFVVVHYNADYKNKVRYRHEVIKVLASSLK